MSDDERGYTWTPEVETPFPAPDLEAFILSQLGETNVLATIIVSKSEEDSQDPETLIWHVPEGLPKNITITVEDTTLTFFAKNWFGLFPYLLEFLEDGQYKNTDDFDQLDGKTSDIHGFYPSPKNVVRFELIVTALPLNESRSYTITVYNNYTGGKNALQEKVNERTNATLGVTP